MARCPECNKTLWRSTNMLCEECAEKKREATSEASQQIAQRAASIVLTTETSQSFPIRQRLGIVTGECVLGMNIVKDFMVGARDLIGGRSETMQKSMRDARNAAMQEMKVEASNLGANAVVAVKIDYQNLTTTAGAIMVVTAVGTAVMADLSA